MYYIVADQKLSRKPTKIHNDEGTILGNISDEVLIANGVVPFVEPVYDTSTHRARDIIVFADHATREIIEKTAEDLKIEANLMIQIIISEHMPEALELILKWIWANRTTNDVTPELQSKLQFLVDKWQEIQA